MLYLEHIKDIIYKQEYLFIMDELKEKVQNLLATMANNKKFDHGNKYYFIDGTEEVSQAIREVELLLLKLKCENEVSSSDQ